MEVHQPYEKLISVCTNFREEGSCCAKRGSKEIVESLKDHVKKSGLKGRVRVARSGCFGLCEMGPNIAVYPDGGARGTWYKGVRSEDVAFIIQTHVDPMMKGK
ncbi:(2Fe-2S) ferredoxin domain-containing protein [bacterium]|nr:(2Fe-2S) ferredoxin domain-containing protein [bacterium]